jgi:hypothetical protein
MTSLGIQADVYSILIHRQVGQYIRLPNQHCDWRYQPDVCPGRPNVRVP